MPLGTFVLTIGGEQQDGTAENKARLHLLPQGVDTLIDADADEFKFPSKFAKATGESISLPYSVTLFTDSTSGESTTIGYKGYVATGNGGRVDFEIAAQEAGTTKALTDLTDEVVVPISTTQQYRDDAETARDEAVAAAASVPSEAELTATYARLANAGLNVKNYGAVGDGRVLYDAACTNASAVVTSATAAFTSADVGKRIVVTDATAPSSTGGVFASTIQSVTNGTTVVCAANSTVTLAGASLAVATDDKPAFDLAVAALRKGEMLYVPTGVYGLAGSLTIPDTCGIRGDGSSYGLATQTQRGGSTLLLMTNIGGTFSGFVWMGTTTGGTPLDTNISSGNMKDICIDAQMLADKSVFQTRPRSRIIDSTIWRGRVYALHTTAQNGRVSNCTAGQPGIGTTVRVDAADYKIHGCDIRQSGIHQIDALNANDLEVSDCHLYSGYSGSLSNIAGGANINLVWNTSGIGGAAVITGNSFDGTNGPHVKVTLGSGCFVRSIAVVGNLAFQVTGYPDNTYAFVEATGPAGAALRGLVVSGNAGQGGAANAQYSALLATSGGAAFTHMILTNNAFNQVAAVYTGTRPTAMEGNAIGKGNGAAVSQSSNLGAATFSGTGAQTAFVIPHGLSQIPTSATVTPGSAAAAALFYATYDATNITVTYTAAPASGTNNVVLNWRASI